MSTRVQWRRGNTAQTATFTGAAGEITVDTDKNVVVVHDNVTPGGYPSPQLSFVQDAYNIANSAFNTANAAGSNITVQNAYNVANGAFNKANSANVLAQSAYNSGNTTFTFAQSGYDYSNTIGTFAQAGYNKANSAYTQAVSANTVAFSAYDHANTAYTNAGDAYNYATSVDTKASAAFNKANSANVLAQASFDRANTKYNSAGGTISGNVDITGQANVNVRLSVGQGSYTVLPNLIAQFTGNSDYYSQINQQNLSGKGSGDVVITADNGTDVVNYIDMGIAGSVYDNTTPNAFPTSKPNDGYLYLVGNPGSSVGGNLVIGTAGSGSFADIVIVQGTGFTETARFKLGQGLVIETGTNSTSTSTGSLVVTGGVGVSGNVYATGIYDNGVELKTYIDTANTFLQANDYATLTAAKSYTNTSNTFNQTYTNNANTALKSYVDGQITVVQNEIASNLATAEAYTDTANTFNRTYTNNANTALKSYVDGQVVVVQNEISSNLATAKAYTDTANTYNQTYTNNANTAMKSYVDGQVITVQNEISSNLATAKSYTDTANTYNQTYTNNANTALKSYVDGQVIIVQNEIAANLATAKSYTDTANTFNQTYTNNANTAMKTYVDSRITANLVTAEAYTDTANTYNQTYTNTANTFNQTYTNNANTALKSYVDGQVVTINNSISSNLATAKSYTDTANTFNQTYTNNANTALKSYVDGQIIVVQNEIASNLATAEGYTDTANTKLKSYVDGKFLPLAGGTVTGAVSITNTTGSSTYQGGALVVTGGVGIGQNLNVLGNTIISGALTVQGTTTYTSTTTTSYTNPYITLNQPSSGYLTSDNGFDIGIDYEYYSSAAPGVRAITGGSGDGTTATLTLPDGLYWAPGSIATISGVSPAGFNGTYLITAASPGSFSFASTQTGSVVTSGALGVARRQTEIGSASVTRSGSTANVTYDGAFSNIAFSTGTQLTIAGFVNSQYNGVQTVATSGPGYFTYTGVNGNPGNETNVGRVIFSQRHAFAGRADDTGNFEFYRVGDFTAANTFAGLYGTVKAGQFLVKPTVSVRSQDLTGGFFTLQTQTVIDTTTATNGTLSNAVGVSFSPLTYSAANTGISYASPYTLYVGGAPVAGNNVTITGNPYAVYVASGGSYFGGGITVNSQGITFSDGTQQTTNAATYTYSVAGFNKANAANVLAQSAYDSGNSTLTYATSGFNKANAANVLAQSAYDFGNTVNTFSFSAYSQANNNLIYATAGFNKANAANVLAQSAYDSGNATLTFATAGFNKANAANVLAQSAYDSGNSTLTYATSGFNKANAANVLAQSSYDFGNTVNTFAFSAYSYANATNVLTVASFNQANAANVLAQSSYNQANNNLIYATAGFNQANAANVLAQSAFNKANSTVQTAFVTVSANGISIAPSSNNDTLTLTAATANGINVLNPSSKTIDFGLRTTGVTAGGYGNTTSIPSITVDAFGRVTSVSNNTIYVPPGTSIVANTGQLTANAATGIVALGLATTAVSAGNYGGSTQIPVLAIDAYGRITSASNTSVSTTISLAAGSGSGSVSGGGTLTVSGGTGITTSASGSTITITNAGVTSLTSNSTARITQSATTGAVTFDLATTAVSAGTYNYSTIQVDAYGRITSASSGTPVTSFNTRTGAVTLGSSDVTTALGYTPANIAGDQFTGQVTVPSLKANTSVTVNTSAFYTSTAYTTSSVSQVTVDSFPTVTYRSAKYFVQMTSGTSYHVIELNVLHDGTNPLLAQYGEIFTGSSLGTFDVSITTGNLNLLFTPTNSATTVKLIRTNIVV